MSSSRAEELRAQLNRWLHEYHVLDEPSVVLADVPAVEGESVPLPERVVCRVLVSGVHAASLRALQ